MPSTLETVADTSARDALSPAVGDTVYQIDNKKINVCASLGPVVWKTYDSDDNTGWVDSSITGISGIHTWWDSNYDANMFTDAGVTNAALGDRLYQWTDRINSRALVQSGTTTRPIWADDGRNGRPRVVFDSTSHDYMDYAIPDTSQSVDWANCIVAIAIRNLTFDNVGGYFNYDYSSKDIFSNYASSSLNTATYKAIAGSKTVYSNLDNTNQFDTLILATNTSSDYTKLYRNGTDVTANYIGVATAATAPTGTFMDSAANFRIPYQQTMEYYEWIIVNAAATPAVCQTINSYWAAKYDISVGTIS
jgi:hypothetical protein